MAQLTVRYVTDGTYSIEQARRRLESEGVLTQSEDGAWQYVSDDPTFPTVYFLPTGLIEMHGHGLNERPQRLEFAKRLSKMLGVEVQPAGEA